MTKTKTMRVITAVILILSLLAQFLPPLTVFAEPTELPPEDMTTGPPEEDGVGLPGGPAGPPSELAPLPPGRPKNPAQILAEARRDDARACQAESTAGTGFSAFNTDSLQNALADDIGQALPPIVNEALTNDLPVRVQTALQRELPSIITDGLRRELPLRLAPQLQGLTRVQYENQFPTLLNQTIKDALPDILTNGLQTRLPRIVAESARGSLGAHLGPGLNNSTAVFVRGQFGGQIGQMTSLIFEIILPYVDELISSITAIGEGMIASGKALKESFAQCIQNPLMCAQALQQGLQLIEQGKELKAKADEILVFLNWLKDIETNQQQLNDDLIKNLTVVIQESLNQGDTMERLTDALAADITGPVINSLEGGMDDIVAAFLGPANQALASIENLPNAFFDPINDALDGFINTTTDVIDAQIRTITSAITAPIDAITKSLSQTIEQTMTAALKPFTDTLTGAFAEAGNFIAAPMNLGAQQINDFFLGNTDITLTPGSGPLYPNSYYQALQEPPSPLGPGVDPLEGVMGPPAELPLTDTITGVASEGAGAANASVTGVAEQAVANQPGLAGSLGNTLSQGLVGGVAGGLGSLVAGIPFVGGYAQNLVTQAVNAAFAAAGLSGAVGLAVPTMEIGALLSTEQSTNKITGQIKGINEQMKKTQDQLLKVTAEIKSLQIESCTYLKTIRRIQLAFEAKEFVQDPDAKKALGRAIEDHNIKLFENIFKFGRGVSPGLTGVEGDNAEQLVPKNLNEHLAKEQQEVAGVFIDELANTESRWKDDIKAKLETEQAETFADRIKPTIDQQTYDKFTEPGGFTDGGGWDTWLKLIQPNNNPAGAEYLAREELARRQALAEQNAREELIAGLGFLGTRKCAEGEMTESGYCRRWETGTPGSVAQGYAVESLTSVIRKTEGTEILDDYITPELEVNLERLGDISNYGAASEGTVYNQPDPCPGPGPCPDSGWGKIPAAKPAERAGQTIPPAPSGVEGPIIPLPEIINNVLTLNLNFETPTLAEVENGDKTNATIIKWRATNADPTEACIADNDWLSGSVAGAPAAAGGSLLPSSGERHIAHPVDFEVKIDRLVGGAGFPNPVLAAKSDAADKLKKKIVFNARLINEIQPDDVYQITFVTANQNLILELGGPNLIDPPTAATVIQLIQREIARRKTEETALAAELAKYSFIGFSGGTLTIAPKLTYGLTCFQGTDSQSQSVEIKR